MPTSSVGEFGIATRDGAATRRAGARRGRARSAQVEPGATMVYKPRAAVEPRPPRRSTSASRPRWSTLSWTAAAHEVDEAARVLGRSKECDIQVADPNVSRRHAEMRQEGAAYWLVDLDRRTALEVNGRRTERAKLESGDRVTLGSTEHRLRARASRSVRAGLRRGRGGPAHAQARVPRPPLPLHLADRAGRQPRPPAAAGELHPQPQQAAGLLGEAAPVQTGRLVVVRSPALDTGDVHVLDSSPLTIGRGAQNDVSVAADEFASSSHARVEPRRDGIWISDDGSTNGTYVNGARIDGAAQAEAGRRRPRRRDRPEVRAMSARPVAPSRPTPAARRRRNEDSYVVDPPLFAVADGMGGAQAGEVASRHRGDGAAATARAARRRRGARRALVQEANRRVYARAQRRRASPGWGRR